MIMGICPTSSSTRSGQNLTRHILLWLLVHTYLHCRSLPLKCTSSISSPKLCRLSSHSSKKGMADYFHNLTSVSISSSLSLTNIVEVLVASVFAKAASWKIILETI